MFCRCPAPTQVRSSRLRDGLEYAQRSRRRAKQPIIDAVIVVQPSDFQQRTKENRLGARPALAGVCYPAGYAEHYARRSAGCDSGPTGNLEGTMASRAKQRSEPPLTDRALLTRQRVDELRAHDHAKVDAYYDLVLRQAGMADKSALQAVRRPRPTISAAGSAPRADSQLAEEIDLHPFTRVEDAKITLEYYLMLAAQCGLPRVRVIHGVGEGVMRRMVRAVLAQSPLVESIDDGPWIAGGDGVTAANLKR